MGSSAHVLRAFRRIDRDVPGVSLSCSTIQTTPRQSIPALSAFFRNLLSPARRIHPGSL